MNSTTAATKDYGKRVAIVTGSAQGIGKAIALRLAEDGFSVCVNDIAANSDLIEEVVEEIRALGRDSCGCVADVSKASEVEKMVSSECVKDLGPLTVMVANAGICQVKSIMELTEEDVRRTFDVNVIGVFNCYKAAVKQFMSQKTGGKLIAAASISGLRASPLVGHYCASKFAVRGISQAFATEFAKRKITANCYAPGVVETGMMERIDDEMCKLMGGRKGQFTGATIETIPMGRTADPEDVAKVVSFLASPDSDYMTGQTLVVDGGMVLT